MAMSKASTCLDGEVRMVLVGKTGCGKSATGNTIAGCKTFVSKLSGASVTKYSEEYSFEREGQSLQLIDVPGFCDTKLSEEYIATEVTKCVAMSHPGLHAILFVIRAGRYTEEDIKTLNQFLRCFGEDSRRYVIVIITGKDDLNDEDTTLDDFVKGSPETLQEFLKSVQNRYLAVNNKGDKNEKNTFVELLLKYVRSMVEKNGGTCYTNEMYEKSEMSLLKAQEEEKQRIMEAKKKEDEEKIRAAIEALKKKLLNNKDLKEEDLERELEKEREKMKMKLEEDHWKQAIRNTREKIARIAGGGVGVAAGAIASFIGFQAVEYIGGAVGAVLAGPPGAVAGFALVGLFSAILGYIGTKIGGKVADSKEDSVTQKSTMTD